MATATVDTSPVPAVATTLVARPRLGDRASWLGLLAAPVRALRQVIYPPLCLVCDADLDEPAADFCPACLSDMIDDADVPTCRRCAATVGPFTNTDSGCPDCRREKHRFDEVVRLGVYARKLRETCLAFKSVSNELLGPALARLLVARRGQRLLSLRPDMVVAVPLHFVRHFARGFNQAQSLARHLARALKVPHRSRILRRVRMTLPQSRLKRDARRDNVRGAFQARPAADLRRATVLLVDDILTTGATCSEAARALKASGAARVVVAVIARSQEQPRA